MLEIFLICKIIEVSGNDIHFTSGFIIPFLLERMKYSYNLGGQLSSIVGEKEYLYRYIDSTGYDAYEQKVYQRMGNGAVTTYDYSKERRRLKNLKVTSPKVTGGAIMDNTYGYDVMDNIISLVNNATPQIMQNGKTIGGSITHNYEYDNWSRLVHADGEFVAGAKSATYNLTMGYDKLYNITSKKLDVTQNNLQFDGTLKAGHDFTYKYDPKDPFRLLSVDAKEYRSSTEEVDTTRREHSYAFDGNGNLVLQLSDLAENIDSASFADTAAMQVRQYLWDEDNHLLAINDNGFVSNYFYDAAGERTVKISAPDLAVFVNGAEALKNDSALVKFVGYVSPYLVVSNGGRYTKHIYAGTQRIASKVGDIEAFGADPRRVEYAGANLKEVDFGEIYDTQTKALLARYDSLGVMNKPRELNDYVGGQSFCCGEKEVASNNQTGDNTFETPDYEQLIFFYHPDHLGSTALVTDNDGNVVQSVAYIPYGEVFIEERNGTWNTPYLFNGKELDEETGLYYYGARYLNPTNGMWLSTDPLFEDYKGVSPYAYCMGNPVKMTDVEGEWVLNVVGAFVAGGLDLGAQVLGNITEGKEAFGNISWTSVVVSAVDGAINPVAGVGVAAAKVGAKAAAKKAASYIPKVAKSKPVQTVVKHLKDNKGDSMKKLGKLSEKWNETKSTGFTKLAKDVGKGALKEGSKAGVVSTIEQLHEDGSVNGHELMTEVGKGASLGGVNAVGKKIKGLTGGFEDKRIDQTFDNAVEFFNMSCKKSWENHE